MRILCLGLLLSFSTFAATDYQKMMKCFKNLKTEHNTIAMRSQFSILNKVTTNCKVFTAEESATSLVLMATQALGNIDGEFPSSCMIDFDSAEKSLVRYFNSKQVITCNVEEAVLSINIGNTNFDHFSTLIFKSIDSSFEFIYEIMEE